MTYRPVPRGLALFNGPRTVPPVPVAGLVVDSMQARWGTLEPTAGKFDLSRIGKALDYATSAGISSCDLRIFAGCYAPDHIKTNFGAVPYVDGADGPAPTAARFWQPGYADRFAALLQAVADQYGNDQRLNSVGHTMPMTLYGEPFMRGDAPTRKALAAAGLTDELDLAAHQTGIDLHAKIMAPHGLRLRIALNPWMSATTGAASVDRLALVIDYAIAKLGLDGVLLQNNSLRTPVLGGLYTPMYALMASYRAKGVPIGFQTATDARIGDTVATLQWAVDQGAVWVEPPPGAWKGVPADKLQAFNTALVAAAAVYDETPEQAKLRELTAQVAELQGQVTAGAAREAALQARIDSATKALTA